MNEPAESPGSPREDCVDRALALAGAGRLGAAIDLLAGAHDPEPSSPRYRGTLANLLSDAGGLQEALGILDQLAEEFSDDALVAANRAIVLQRLDRPDAELRERRRALELAPANAALAWGYLDAVRRVLGAKEFLAETERLRTGFSNDPEFLRNVGASAGQVGSFDLSRALLESAVALAPDDAMAWADLAGTLTALHEHDQAEHAAMNALERDPGDYVALANLGYIAECRGTRRQAISFYEKSLAANPDYQRARDDLARLRSRARRHHGSDGR